MESLQIKVGQISLSILDDSGEPRGIFKFNPQDIKVARKVSDLIVDFKTKQVEFELKEKNCTDSDGKIRLLDELVDYFKENIDSIWGQGSSNILFGDASTLTMFDDFFTGITKYYKKESQKRTTKYKK